MSKSRHVQRGPMKLFFSSRFLSKKLWSHLLLLTLSLTKLKSDRNVQNCPKCDAGLSDVWGVVSHLFIGKLIFFEVINSS